MINIVYAGNPEFAVAPLKSLIKHPDICVKAVITQEDKKRSRGKMEPCEVKKAALLADLTVYSTDHINSRESISYLRQLRPDFIVVVAFGQKIGKEILNEFKDRVINLHASILPDFRGPAPIQFALLEGLNQTGNSVMLIDEGMDTGDILSVCTMPIDEEDDAGTLGEKLSQIGGDCLIDTMKNYDKCYNNRKTQTTPRYTSRKISKDMGSIDWNSSAQEIDRKKRAFTPWPGVYFKYFDQIVKVHHFQVIQPKLSEETPGNIFRVDDSGCYVNCLDATIQLTELQFPGKKRMSVKDFLKGNIIEKISIK